MVIDGLVKNGKILNDETLKVVLGRSSLAQARCMAWISSGHWYDEWAGWIYREAVDEMGITDTSIYVLHGEVC